MAPCPSARHGRIRDAAPLSRFDGSIDAGSATQTDGRFRVGLAPTPTVGAACSMHETHCGKPHARVGAAHGAVSTISTNLNANTSRGHFSYRHAWA
eukprot:360019-Chlamydomonas_euryale.AAC.9